MKRSIYHLASASIILLSLTVSFLAIAAPKPIHRKALKKPVQQNQSLCGTVVEKRGNQMPGPGRSLPAGKPVMREVAVFSVLTTDQVVSDDAGFITDLKGTQPVQTVQAGSNGTFCFSKLPAGQYSVLVHEKQGWYANLFDAKNRINPVMIQPGKTSTMTIEITHAAAF